MTKGFDGTNEELNALKKTWLSPRVRCWLTGVRTEQVAGDYYFSRSLDPYVCAQVIMENWRAKQGALRDEAPDPSVSDVQEAGARPSGQIGDRLSNLEHVLDHAVGDLRELVREVPPSSGSKAAKDYEAA